MTNGSFTLRKERRVGECDINITLGVMTCLRASLSHVYENLYLRCSPYANNFINPRRFQICLGGNVAGQVCLWAAWCELVCEFRDKEKSCQIIVIILHVFLLSNHKKKSLRKLTAPGTANRITRLFAVNSLMLILLAGESSNKSTDGTWSPSWRRRKFVKFRRIFNKYFQN